MYNSANNNKYNENSSAPFTIIIKMKNTESTNDNIARMGKIALGKRLEQLNWNHTAAKRNKTNLELTFEKFDEANNIIDCTNLPENWLAYIPDYKIYKIGIIKDVDLNISNEYILSEVSKVYPNSKVERIKRLIRNKMTEQTEVKDTKNVKISFLANSMSSSIFINRLHFRVEPYIQAVRQCNKCFKFGHSSKFCRSDKEVCIHCGDLHQYQEDAPCVNDEPKCYNCGEAHRANDRNCRVYIAEKEIRTAAAYENVSIEDARERLKAGSCNTYRTKHLGVSYAEATRKPENNSQSDSAKINDNNNSVLKELVNLVKTVVQQNKEILEQNTKLINAFLEDSSSSREKD